MSNAMNQLPISLGQPQRQAALQKLLPDTRDTAAWHAALTAEIGQHLSPAHAGILGTPVTEGEKIGWRAPGQRIKGFSTLSGQDRDALKAAIMSILSDIRRLGESGAAPTVAQAWPALREIPTIDSIYAVDGRPVLAAWGHAAAGAARPAGLLASLDDGIAWQPPGKGPAGTWIAAFLTMGVLGAAAGLLAPLLAPQTVVSAAGAVGIALLPPPQQCRVTPEDQDLLNRVNAADTRQKILQSQLAQLTEEIARRRLQCPPPGPAPAPPAQTPQRRSELPPPAPPAQQAENPPQPPAPQVAERTDRPGHFGFRWNQRDNGTILCVYQGSPAARSGVRRGDIVQTLDGKPYAQVPARTFTITVSGRPMRIESRAHQGQVVKLGILRGRQRLEVTVQAQGQELFRTRCV